MARIWPSRDVTQMPCRRHGAVTHGGDHLRMTIPAIDPNHLKEPGMKDFPTPTFALSQFFGM